MTQSAIRAYGVKEQSLHVNEIDHYIEELTLNGFTIINGGYSAEEQASFADAFDAALSIQIERFGYDALRKIDEHNTIRAPLTLDPIFIRLAQNPEVLSIAERIFRGSADNGTFILNQQNGVLNPPRGELYNQAAWHRDLPYQHFVSSRPLAINALYCIEPFTIENGATLVARGTHRHESFPSERYLLKTAEPASAPAGSFLVLDSMIYHTGGMNISDKSRRAVNNVYTLPFIRQQIDLPSAFPKDVDLPTATKKLFGFDVRAVNSPADYFQRRAVKFGV
jgi:ectoine hydroxylase-related dioxygenase (phytanoyl-CoA dioxygenase family)